MIRLVLAFLLSLTATWPITAAEAPRQPGPVDAIQAIYVAYRGATLGGPALRQVYSARLTRLIAADEAATPEGEVGTIDWDVFVNGNDWRLGPVTVDLIAQSGDRAEVRARFTNHEQPRENRFDLVREGGRWLVDDIRTTNSQGPWSMVKTLTDAASRPPQ
ncbi:DUF3828 domain-containing protein [Phreatobacter aquaticus]|uniref:DUF3828 domain-containing protein n=1 Tax=Phreatobacter aquaticus TaxID=2570229 RepID=A0A4D7QHM5_9HYPH|nr:DUF3828 domain-containing protein [Phreatobacter aquaticus]QCK86221.1 DUF3828 domain-containing protein [Phreatobacter aquaticus]